MLKVEVRDKEVKKQITYPCIMQSISTNLIVLMIARGSGTVLVEDYKYKVGHCSSAWDTGAFIIFNGTITLSNDN